MAFAMTAALLTPTTTAHIIDIREHASTANPTYEKVDNLPFGLVFIASYASKVTIGILEIIDDGFAPAPIGEADAMSGSAAKLGVGKVQKLVLDVLQTDFNKMQKADVALFRAAFKVYLGECVIKNGALPATGMQALMNVPGDLMEAIEPTTLGIAATSQSSTYVTISSGTTTNCHDIYDYMDTQKPTIMTAMIDKLKQQNPDLNLALESSQEAIGEALYAAGLKTKSYADVGSYAAGLKVTAINVPMAYLTKEVINETNSELIGISTLANMNTEKNAFNMMMDGAAMVAWINKIAPFIIHYSLLFSYSLFLLVIPIAMGLGWENSKKILSNYAFGIIAIHLGYITSSIANDLILFYSQMNTLDYMASLGNNATSLATINEFAKYAGEMAGLSGILLLSSYSIGSAIIFKGETAAAQGMMSTAAGRFQNNMMNTTEDISRKMAYDEAETRQKQQASNFLKQNGFGAPPVGISEIEFARSLQNELSGIAGGMGFAEMRAKGMIPSAGGGSSSFDSSYMGGIANQSVQSTASVATFGANTRSFRHIWEKCDKEF